MSAIFEPGRIKQLALRNRLVRSATFEGMADDDGAPTQALFDLYRRLARGGVGLIVTGYAYVSTDGRNPFAGMLGIDRDELIPRYRELVDHVHEHGAKLAMQIAHCGRQTTAEALGEQPMAPSAVRDGSTFTTPRVMDEGDIERVVEDFGQAARRAREAGLDAVQLHGAHGYLISQFLCPHTNRRQDRWGGSIDNRMRFVRHVYRRCRELVGDDFPLLIKISAYDQMRRGLRVDEGIEMARQMGQLGFDGIEVSCGIAEDGMSTTRGDVPVEAILDEWDMFGRKNALFRWGMRHFGRWLVRPPPLTQAFNREAARAIKERVDVPVWLVGGVTELSAMEEVLESGDADYIALCRALIADARFPRKLESGRKTESICVHCNLCLAYMATTPLRCYHGKRIASAAGEQR
jgi:2,4-dienoyl-CoA reductase-like NADH-dependent reductase (Old Yellow Enzyme family)